MSEHKQFSHRTFRIWMIVNSVLLVAISAWLIKPSTEDLDPDTAATNQDTGISAAPATAPKIPTKEAVLALPGQRFGISTPEVPWSTAALDKVSTNAGARPSMAMYFVRWTDDFDVKPVVRSYEQGVLPIVSWEPWAGIKEGTSQPEFALSKIIGGTFDPYITKFATGMRDAKFPVAIRFAHEMNGNWYPWSERRSGNKKGEYVRAWRHVHDIFAKVGATNVIWIWSPNILRPVPNVSLAALYPGDKYVDWAGLVGYAVNESTAAPVFEPTLDALRKFTQRPAVITETGAQPSSHKAGWIKDFFRWLPTRPDVAGFVWFEYDKEQGGNADWRFTANAQTKKAFQDGIKEVRLTPAPNAQQ